MSCFSVWDIQGCGCTSAPVTCLPCTPCYIPKRDLTVSWGGGTYGGGSTTLVFDGTGTWTGSHDFADGILGVVTFTLQCSFNSVAFAVSSNLGPQCSYPPSSNPSTLRISSFTCNPFSFTFDGTYDGVATYCGNFCSPPPFGTCRIANFTVSDPGPTLVCPCPCTVKVTGCNGLPLAGATVTLSGGAGSGTTDSSGNVVFAVVPGSFDITVSKTRFTTTTFNGQSLACATTTTVSMAGHVASGFACSNLCAIPLATTLLASSNCGHSNVSLIYDGSSQWTDGFTTFHANGTVDAGATMGTGCTGSGLTASSVSCPPAMALIYNFGGATVTVTE